jgi:hypothetical protein
MSEGARRQLRRKILEGRGAVVDSISEEHKALVALRCEVIASKFQLSDEVDCTPLRTVKLQKSIVAQGVQLWLQSEAGDEWRDRWCERTADFEDRLEAETQGWAAQQLVRRRCRRKTKMSNTYGHEKWNRGRG